MEIAKVELAALEVAVKDQRTEVEELRELEFSLVGGGMGDVVFI